MMLNLLEKYISYRLLILNEPTVRTYVNDPMNMYKLDII